MNIICKDEEKNFKKFFTWKELVKFWKINHLNFFWNNINVHGHWCSKKLKIPFLRLKSLVLDNSVWSFKIKSAHSFKHCELIFSNDCKTMKFPPASCFAHNRSLYLKAFTLLYIAITCFKFRMLRWPIRSVRNAI